MSAPPSIDSPVRSGHRLRLYVDGRQVGESTPLEPAALNLTPAAPLLIGGGQAEFFHGRMRDVRLYRRAAEDVELAKIVAAGLEPQD